MLENPRCPAVAVRCTEAAGGSLFRELMPAPEIAAMQSAVHSSKQFLLQARIQTRPAPRPSHCWHHVAGGGGRHWALITTASPLASTSSTARHCLAPESTSRRSKQQLALAQRTHTFTAAPATQRKHQFSNSSGSCREETRAWHSMSTVSAARCSWGCDRLPAYAKQSPGGIAGRWAQLAVLPHHWGWLPPPLSPLLLLPVLGPAR